MLPEGKKAMGKVVRIKGVQYMEMEVDLPLVGEHIMQCIHDVS